MARTEILCHLDVSLSRACNVLMVPLLESILNSLSRSVCRSMVYLQRIQARRRVIIDQQREKAHTVLDFSAGSSVHHIVITNDPEGSHLGSSQINT